mmetsp:Transcript_15572/g.33989  ORF Transcript_15572/g.33989 Transcript_15572/m.33989 type:complete len:302 (+) Transcript_15572:195-1100(+)
MRSRRPAFAFRRDPSQRHGLQRALVHLRVPEGVGVVPREHGRQRLVVHGLQRAERYLVGHVPERIFQFPRHLVQAHQARHGHEREQRSYPEDVGVLVHHERHGQAHEHREECAQLGVREGERDVHDLPRLVVEEHAVAEELDEAADDRRVDLSQAPSEMLPYHEIQQPRRRQLGFGVGSPCFLQEQDLGVRDAADDEERPRCVVLGPVAGQPIQPQPVVEDAERMLEQVANVPGQVVGIDGRPRRAGDVKSQRGLAPLRIVPERGQRHGAGQRGQVRQLLQEEGRSPPLGLECKVLIRQAR